MTDEFQKYRDCPAMQGGLFIAQNGDTKPCCFFKSPESGIRSEYSLLIHEKLLLETDVANDCEHCINIERNGGQWSARQSLLKAPPHYVISVFLSNTCNLSCVTCSELSSSKVLNDRLAMGMIDQSRKIEVQQFNTLSENKITLVKEAILSKQLAHNLRLEIFGGEPSIDPAVSKLIDWLLDTGMSKTLNLSISTNCKLPFNKITENIDQFKTVRINVSLDAIGPKFDYLRYGAEWGNSVVVFEHYYDLSRRIEI